MQEMWIVNPELENLIEKKIPFLQPLASKRHVTAEGKKVIVSGYLEGERSNIDRVFCVLEDIEASAPTFTVMPKSPLPHNYVEVGIHLKNDLLFAASTRYNLPSVFSIYNMKDQKIIYERYSKDTFENMFSVGNTLFIHTTTPRKGHNQITYKQHNVLALDIKKWL